MLAVLCTVCVASLAVERRDAPSRQPSASPTPTAPLARSDEAPPQAEEEPPPEFRFYVISRKEVCSGIGRLYVLSKKDESWTASSLAMLGCRLGPQGKRSRPMPGLMKEIAETTHGMRGQGVHKVSNIALGDEVVRKKGHVKRGLSLEDLSQPKKRARTGGFGMA